MSRLGLRLELSLGVAGALCMSFAILQLLFTPAHSTTLSDWDDLLSLISGVSFERLQWTTGGLILAVPLLLFGCRGMVRALGVRGPLLAALIEVLIYSVPVVWVSLMMQVVQLSLSFQSASNPVRLADAAFQLLAPLNLVLGAVFWGAGLFAALLVLTKRTSLSSWSIVAFPQVIGPAIGLVGASLGGSTAFAVWLASWPIGCAFSFAMLAGSLTKDD